MGAPATSGHAMGGHAMDGHAMDGHATASYAHRGDGARYGRSYEGGAPIYDSYGGQGYYEGGAPIYDSCSDGSYGTGYGCRGYGVPFVGGVINGIFGGYAPY